MNTFDAGDKIVDHADAKVGEEHPATSATVKELARTEKGSLLDTTGTVADATTILATGQWMSAEESTMDPLGNMSYIYIYIETI